MRDTDHQKESPIKVPTPLCRNTNLITCVKAKRHRQHAVRPRVEDAHRRDDSRLGIDSTNIVSSRYRLDGYRADRVSRHTSPVTMARRADRGYKLYFRYVKIEDVKCGVCVECEAGGKRAVVKMKNSNTSGLIKHLRLHHPSIYLDKVGNGGGPEDRKPFLDPSANNENDCSCRTTLPEGISEVSESQPGCSYPNFEMDVKTSSSSPRKWKLGSKMDQPPRKFKNVDCSQRFGEFDQESPSSHGFPPPDEAPVFLNESYMDLVKTEQEDDVPERVVPEETEDEFLAAGRKYAFDLRDMSREQRIILERIVSEVIYHGKSGRLNEGSGFVLGNF